MKQPPLAHLPDANPPPASQGRCLEKDEHPDADLEGSLFLLDQYVAERKRKVATLLSDLKNDKDRGES